MKQEVSFTLESIVKLITIFFLISSSPKVWGNFFHREYFETHLRWSIDVSRDEVVVSRERERILIKSLNEKVLDKIEKEIREKGLNTRYFKKGRWERSRDQNNFSFIALELQRSDIELFTFYGEDEKKYIIDFWGGAIFTEKVATQETKGRTLASYQANKKKIKKKQRTEVKTKTKVRSSSLKKMARLKKGPYRDFRYGAPFIWHYDPLAPFLDAEVDLKRKTPEVFYPIKNRQYEKGEREAHLQLAINLYRKKKWGLMYKSIKLFQKKYGDDYEQGLIEYLKANAILREAFSKGKKKPAKIAINILSNIAELDLDYAMKKGILKYILQHYVDGQEYIKALDLSKKLYVVSRDNRDYIESQYAAKAMLYNLSQLSKSKKLINYSMIRR